MEDKQRDDVKELLTTQEAAHQQFSENFFKWKANEKTAVSNQELEEEMAFMDHPHQFESGWTGRMSPFIKETIYREYLRGMAIKDLSLKYGIL